MLLGVPGSNPRWLIPEDGRALGATLANWSPYRRSSRMMWHVIRESSCNGMLDALPFVERFDASNDVDWRALGWSGVEAPQIAIYMGTPGPTQKAVIHLVDRRTAQCKAIVKVPIGSAAKNAILREAAALRAVSEEHFCAAPRLLHLDRERGVSVQQFVAGRSASRKLKAEYFEVLRSLLLPDQQTSLAAHAIGWEAALELVEQRRTGDLVQRAKQRLEDDQPLPACWVHGDFAPWNLRDRSELPPILIDWEDAERGGLPLHDAFHFLHMQNFLFGARPQLHAADLAEFGASCGLSVVQCRKLELAYLLHAYLQSLGRNQSHSEFLLKTLARGVQADYESCPLLSGGPAREAFPRSEGARGHRAQLFDLMIATLNGAEIPYCVLSGYEVGHATSDVDIMVAPEHRHRMPHLLANVAGRAGASLVQAIQHETTATYFVLAGLHDGQLSCLDVDCYTDYLRDGRTWLRAEEVIARRQERGDFFVPCVKDEFTYYLIKKVLKQSLSMRQLTQLSDLFIQRPRECRKALARFFPERAHAVESGILAQNLYWFEQQMPAMHRELLVSRSVEGHFRHCAGQLREIGRRLRRVAQPTGLWVEVPGAQVRVAEELIARLAPIFRRTRLLSASTGPLKTVAGILLGRIRSTLVISVDEHVPSPGGARLLGGGLAPDLKLHLAKQGAAGACNAILNLLARRIGNRMHLRDAPVPESATSSLRASEPVRFSTAGSR